MVTDNLEVIGLGCGSGRGERKEGSVFVLNTPKSVNTSEIPPSIRPSFLHDELLTVVRAGEEVYTSSIAEVERSIQIHLVQKLGQAVVGRLQPFFGGF